MAKKYSRKKKYKGGTKPPQKKKDDIRNLNVGNIQIPSLLSDVFMDWLEDYKFFTTDNDYSRNLNIEDITEIKKIHEIIMRHLGDNMLELFKQKNEGFVFNEIDPIILDHTDLYIRPLKNQEMSVEDITDINISEEFEKIVVKIKEFLDNIKKNMNKEKGEEEDEQEKEKEEEEEEEKEKEEKEEQEKEEEEEKEKKEEEEKEEEEKTVDKEEEKRKKIEKSIKDFFFNKIYKNSNFRKPLLDNTLFRYIRIIEIVFIENFDYVIKGTESYYKMLKNIVVAFTTSNKK